HVVLTAQASSYIHEPGLIGELEGENAYVRRRMATAYMLWWDEGCGNCGCLTCINPRFDVRGAPPLPETGFYLFGGSVKAHQKQGAIVVTEAKAKVRVSSVQGGKTVIRSGRASVDGVYRAKWRVGKLPGTAAVTVVATGHDGTEVTRTGSFSVL